MHLPLLLLSILVGDIYLSPIKTQQICKRIKKEKKKRKEKKKKVPTHANNNKTMTLKNSKK